MELAFLIIAIVTALIGVVLVLFYIVSKKREDTLFKQRMEQIKKGVRK